eukprot:11792755-Prorocentrum_lima.AAC.1
MTSSLVGSEMCIRDRLLFFRLRTVPEQPATGVGGALPSLAAGAAAAAVSYTHLTLPTICSV